jgi:hypothetical protein
LLFLVRVEDSAKKSAIGARCAELSEGIFASNSLCKKLLYVAGEGDTRKPEFKRTSEGSSRDDKFSSKHYLSSSWNTEFQTTYLHL